ncbi:MAG: PEP-CTERM sorting domain-containing protein [Bythopirellula sp.]|nr:PEP-CTERM sorting domain-containing protein [Bythopirellula sp.]
MTFTWYGSAWAVTDWKLTVPNKTGQTANDFHAVFVGTGGSVNNVNVSTDPAGNGVPALNGPVGGSNGFDITWPAAGGIFNNEVIQVDFTTDFPGILPNSAYWTKNGANIGNVAPQDTWLTPLETLSIDVACVGEDCGLHPVGELVVGTNGGGISTNQGDIKAEFTHNQVDFDTAAELCCAGHFNWLNVVRSGSPAGSTPDDPDQAGQQNQTFPWVDPLRGGNLGFGFDLHDDNLPYYWSEQVIANGPGPDDNVVEEVSLNTAGATLSYFDHPTNAAGTTWQFETYLVAVAGPVGDLVKKRFQVIAGFSWIFTDINNANNNGEIISNLLEIPVNMATLPALITNLNGVLDRHEGFKDWTIMKNICVPEPSSLAIMVVMFAMVAAGRKRRF